MHLLGNFSPFFLISTYVTFIYKIGKNGGIFLNSNISLISFVSAQLASRRTYSFFIS
ncbi:hypothetical protein NEOC65_001519 [Neochlamydia sp. AcF65]|nr:hypothetical protein [Neochlamydia sp. AcF65]